MFISATVVRLLLCSPLYSFSLAALTELNFNMTGYNLNLPSFILDKELEFLKAPAWSCSWDIDSSHHVDFVGTDKKIKIGINGVAFLKASQEGTYDVVIVDSSDPIGKVTRMATESLIKYHSIEPSWEAH